jgi:hypothetical protein
MILCDLAGAVSVGSIVVALAAGRLTHVHLLVVATADGICSVFFTIAEVGAAIGGTLAPSLATLERRVRAATGVGT